MASDSFTGENTLTTLNNALQAAQAQLTADQQALAKIQQDPNYIYLITRWNKVQNMANTWIDSGGAMWTTGPNGDAAHEHAMAKTQIDAYNQQMASLQGNITTDNIAVQAAQDALTKFQNSPAGQTLAAGESTAIANQSATQLSAQEAQTALANAKAAKQKFLVTTGIIVIAVVGIIFIIIYIKKKDKKSA